jgi:hypothetical protein
MGTPSGKATVLRFSPIRDMTNAQFLEKFHTSVSIVEQFIRIDTSVVQTGLRKEGVPYITQPTIKQVEKANSAIKKRFLAVAFMGASDKVRFGKLLEDLENDYMKGSNNYPTMVTPAYNIMVNYKN